MEYEQYINQMVALQELLLDFFDDTDTSEDNYNKLLKFIEETKMSKSHADLHQFISLLASIFDNYHRHAFLFGKIKQILFYYKNEINTYFSNIELFNIFQNNNLILLFLIENEFLILNDSILDLLKYSKRFFFYPEIKNSLENDLNTQISNEQLEIDEFFYEKRRIGENDLYICSLIRQDSIEDFVSYVNRINLKLSSKIFKSIYETNSFLIDKTPSLIEYAVFFGSIQVFNYLRLNQVELTSSLWLYAIHGKNPDIIHILEEYKVYPEDKSFNKCFEEAVKCHHNDIADYIQNNLLCDESNLCDINPFKYHNYKFFPKNFDNKFLIYYIRYNYATIIDILLTSKLIDPNTTISKYFTLLHFTFYFNLYEIHNLLISHPEIKLGENAFKCCSRLNRIIFNSPNKSIDFFNGILNLPISNSLNTIGKYSFCLCSSLIEVSLPPTISSIKKGAFSCSSVESISFPSSFIEFEKGWCKNTHKLTKITVDSNNHYLKQIDNKFLIGKSSKESKIFDILIFCVRNIQTGIIPNSIEIIKSFSFENCTNIQNIDIPLSVLKIEKGAFKGCSSLTKITIPQFVHSIGKFSFTDCINLEHVSFPVPRNYKSDNIFKRYEPLLTMSFSLTEIGEGSFKNCKSLKHIQIPSSITSIKDDVFRDCSSLEKINLPTSLRTIGNCSFSNCTSLEKINLPTSLRTIGNYAFSNCTSLEKINLPTSLISIGDYAFDKCTSLKQMNIPQSTKIGFRIFSKSFKQNQKINNSSRISAKFQPSFKEKYMIDINIMMVGLYYTGKTCIVQSYVYEHFIDQFQGTITFTPYFKKIIIDDTNVRVKLYDSNYRLIEYIWMDTVIHGYMLVFDLSDRDSLYFAIDWYISFKENHVENKYAFVLVGNKSDLKQRITYEEVEEIAREQKLEYFEISAKNYLGIAELFNHFTSYIYNDIVSHDK